MSKNKYPLGALKDKEDIRKIKLSQFAQAIQVPEKYFVNSGLPIQDQKKLGACVGHAHARVHQYLEKLENGNKEVPKLSPRYIYGLAKQMDGMPQMQGTWPRIASNISVNFGCATESLIPNDTGLSHEQYITIQNSDVVKKDAKPYRIKGYADVSQETFATYDELQQAIFKYGEIPASISVGNYSNPIRKGKNGLHRVVLVGYGFEKLVAKKDGVVPKGKKEGRIFFANSWGKKWGVNGYGWFDMKNQEVTDVEVYTDIPNEIIDEAKAKPKAVITRNVGNDKQTLGEMVATKNGETLVCKTLELADKGNQKNISCIPKGEYVAKLYNSPKRGLVYQLQDVPNRTAIQIHVGNYYTDIEGCILIGDNFSDINKDGYADVINSRLTFDKFMAFFGGEDFTLIIK